MNIRWMVPFVAFDGTAYTLNIYAENYSGTPINLTGGSQPFVTEEDSSIDILSPIRAQSGYVCIVTDRATWLEVITLGSLVTLTTGNTVKWKGYISKEAFNGDAFEPVKEYQIPVHCMLSHLQSEKFVVSPFDIPTFATILNEAFGLFPAEGRPTSMLWNSTIADTDGLPRFLECRFQRSNFYDADKTPEEGVTMKSDATYYDVVSEICKYFGIILCIQGEELMFLTTDDYWMCYRSTMQDLQDIERYGASGLHQIEQVRPIAPTLQSLEYMSADNQESILQPVRDIDIIGDINPYEDFDAQYPEETVREWIDEHATNIRETTYNANCKLFTRQFTLPDIHEMYVPGMNTILYYVYANSLVTLRIYGGLAGEEGEVFGAEVSSRDWCQTDERADKLDYNFRNLLHIKARSDTGFPVFGLYSNKAVTLKAGSGAINLDYTASSDATTPNGGGVPPGTPAMEWILKIGDHYWNGSAWTHTKSSFTVAWKVPTEGGKIETIETNRFLGDGYDGLRGRMIPINQNLSGQISLECTGTLANIYIEKLAISYARPNSNALGAKAKLQDTIEVKSETGVQVTESYSQECKFATSPDVNGYGVVLDFNGVALESYPYQRGSRRPEDQRNGMIQYRMNRPLSVLDVIVKDSGAIANRFEWIDEGEWTSYNILSIAKDWREDSVKLKLIEI